MCKDLHYCGDSRESALVSDKMCLSGLDSECPDGMSCYKDISAIERDKMHYCGYSKDEAEYCALPCPSSLSSECPDNMSCFHNIKSSQCNYFVKPPREKYPQLFSNTLFPGQSPNFDNSGSEDYTCDSIDMPDPFGGVDQISTIFDTHSIAERTHGNMFDIFATRAIIITGFDLHIASISEVTVELYITCCNVNTYQNVMRHPRAWVLMANASIQGQGQGEKTRIETDLFDVACVPQGSSRGLYLTATEPVFILSQLMMKTGQVYIENDDVIIYVGVGKRYWFRPEKQMDAVSQKSSILLFCKYFSYFSTLVMNRYGME